MKIRFVDHDAGWPTVLMIIGVVIVGVLGAIGYIKNIIAIFGLSLADNLGEIIVRVAGIFFFFIGAIAGWF